MSMALTDAQLFGEDDAEQSPEGDASASSYDEEPLYQNCTARCAAAVF